MSGGLIGFITKLPRLFVDAIRFDYWYHEYQDVVEKPFVCPNCGGEFHKKWYHMLFHRYTTIRTFGKANLKCPHCKVTDACRWTGMDRFGDYQP